MGNYCYNCLHPIREYQIITQKTLKTFHFYPIKIEIRGLKIDEIVNIRKTVRDLDNPLLNAHIYNIIRVLEYMLEHDELTRNNRIHYYSFSSQPMVPLLQIRNISAVDCVENGTIYYYQKKCILENL